MKIIGDDYELKTSQKRHYLRGIIGNHSKRLLLYLAQYVNKMISALVVKCLVSTVRKGKDGRIGERRARE